MNQPPQKLWHDIITEPFTWLFVAISQPASTYKSKNGLKIVDTRLKLLKLCLLLFLTSYAFMLVARLVRFLLFKYNLIYQYNPYDLSNIFIPSMNIWFSIVLGLIFILLGDELFGVMYGLGTSIALITLSTFIHLFDPANSDTFSLSYNLPAYLLTGFVIGILFSMAFTITDGVFVNTTRIIMRGIGFGLVLLIILHHLENTSFQDLWDGIKSYGSSSGLIGCVAVGIALSIVGNISVAHPVERIENIVIGGVRGGIVFGITFAFVLFFMSFIFGKKATDIDNLSMVSIFLGFVGSYMVSMKSTVVRGTTIIIGSIIVLIFLASTADNTIFPTLNTLASSTSPYSFIYYIILNLALGAVGGSICSNKNIIILIIISVVILMLELINARVSGLAGTFAISFKGSIIAGFAGGIAACIITGFTINFFKIQNREWMSEFARSLGFSIAIIATLYSMQFAGIDNSAYSVMQTPFLIGFGCLVGYNYRLLFYPLRLLVKPISKIKTFIDGKSNSKFRLLVSISIIIAIIMTLYFHNDYILAIIPIILALIAWLETPKPDK